MASKQAKLTSVKDVAGQVNRTQVWVYNKATALLEDEANGDPAKGKFVRVVKDTAKRRGPKNVLRFTVAGVQKIVKMDEESPRRPRRNRVAEAIEAIQPVMEQPEAVETVEEPVEEPVEVASGE